MSICRFTVSASRDIEDIIDQIADRQGFDAADRYLQKINAKCQSIANFPNMGRSRNELAPSLRSLPIDDYLIFYRAIDNGVEIIRVVSGYRDLEALFSEE
ncbi:type II toxin-antitoxin system RelE/ParE family toxin [Microcoleus sp. FACHB-1515]|uniref:type II toxin-antitoxin system RelE/ParE family toxin n=1 Tax=Cyanophyceae TaxID=3028117 RepID=UPI001684C909|nr:type II toxin-antitoxin system RelE/ParE family toxin [Microcoleus sp. FACHB-1515]MBD2093038.1 type II toxin-antitoxin system RelE/ParE family toxin [Microcoleus sp. FACHB-1515]